MTAGRPVIEATDNLALYQGGDMFQVSTNRVLAAAVLILALAGVAGAISAQRRL
jgi:hypothetical protein